MPPDDAHMDARMHVMMTSVYGKMGRQSAGCICKREEQGIACTSGGVRGCIYSFVLLPSGGIILSGEIYNLKAATEEVLIAAL